MDEEWKHPKLIQGHEAEFGSMVEAFSQQTAVVYFCPAMCPHQRKQPNYYLLSQSPIYRELGVHGSEIIEYKTAFCALYATRADIDCVFQ